MPILVGGLLISGGSSISSGRREQLAQAGAGARKLTRNPGDAAPRRLEGLGRNRLDPLKEARRPIRAR